jgi:glycosyltransferase involved in cell wall biosynthesis
VPLIVAEDEPHSPEIELVQYGTNALPFSSNDAHSLAAQLIGLSSDRDKAQEMGVNGRRRVASDFSVETMIRGFDEAIVYAHSSE